MSVLGLDHVQLGARLSASGATVIWDDRVAGQRRFYSEDPWGNRLELLASAD